MTLRMSAPAPIGTPAPGLAAADTVGDITDRRGEIIRVVPLLDGTEIVVDEQRGAAGTVRKDQRSRRLAAGKAPRRRADPQPGPFGYRSTGVEPGQSWVEIAGHDNHLSPAFITAPPEARNEVPDRSEHVRRGVPDVAPSVPAEIHSVGEIRRRHELALAHCAGPRPDHLRGRNIALVKNFQRGEKFGPEHRAPAALISKRRERRGHVERAHGPAEIAFDSPQGNDKPRLNAVLLPNPLQQRPIFDELLSRLVDSILRDDLLKILGEGHLVLGLLAVELNNPRQKRYLLESGLDRRRPDAARDRVAPHLGEKLIEVAPRRRRNPAPQRHREQRSRSEQCPAARAERHHRHAPAVKLSQSPSAIRPDPLQPRTARRFSLRPVFRDQRYRIWSVFSPISLVMPA